MRIKKASTKATNNTQSCHQLVENFCFWFVPHKLQTRPTPKKVKSVKNIDMFIGENVFMAGETLLSSRASLLSRPWHDLNSLLSLQSDIIFALILFMWLNLGVEEFSSEMPRKSGASLQQDKESFSLRLRKICCRFEIVIFKKNTCSHNN